MSRLFIPNAKTVCNDKAELYELEDFLSPSECKHLIRLIKNNLRPSELINNNAPDHNFRTNWSCDLDDLYDPIANDIDLRISRLLGFPPDQSEFMQGQYYDIGHQFKPHMDYFEKEDLKKYAEHLGQRTYTFLLYLNTVNTGGETYFPELDLKFNTKEGSALIWNNLLSNGDPNPFSIHQGLPIIDGQKFIITKWFRSNIFPPKQSKSSAEYIKNYTKFGLLKKSIPDNLFHKLAAYYHSSISSIDTEKGSEHLISSSENNAGSQILELTDTLRDEVKKVLQPIAEAWTGTQLKPTYVYGIRIYLRGATLAEHRDRPNSHVIGIILNIDQDVEEDWAFEIDDHDYRKYHVLLRAGEMLLYEGAKLCHGRPFPLRGNRYANIFCHFVPNLWISIEE